MGDRGVKRGEVFVGLGASWERGLVLKTIDFKFNDKIQLKVCYFLGELFRLARISSNIYPLEDRACMVWTRGLHGNMKWEARELST